MIIYPGTLREMGERPRVHGNGFIQLDLSDSFRLHIWGDPRIPRQATATPIHDHTFGFQSTIIVGRLLNVVHEIIEKEYGDFNIFEAVCRDGEDTELRRMKKQCIVQVAHTEMVNANSWITKYRMPPHVFHETLAPDGPAATIIRKEKKRIQPDKHVRARVLVPVNAAPDNSFNRYEADEDLLWQIIEDTLKLQFAVK